MDSPGGSQAAFQRVRQFNCPNCGGELEVFNKRTRYVGCHYCGAQLDASSEAAEMLLKLDEPGAHPPQSFIDLGVEFVFDGLRYHTVGRRRWQADYMEFWEEVDEDGREWGFSRETWVYDEWLLLSELGNIIYLNEDPEGYSLVEEVVPLTPTLPLNRNEPVNFFGGSPQVIREHGEARVIHAQGESTYQVAYGDRVLFAMYEEKDTEFICEWRLNDNGEIREIEFHRAVPVSEGELRKAVDAVESGGEGGSLEQAFADADKVSTLEGIEKQVNRAKFWRFAGNVMLLAGLVCLVMVFRGCSGGERVAGKQFNFRFEPGSEYIKRGRGGRAGNNKPKMAKIGIVPFEVTEGGRAYELQIRSQFRPDNSWVYIGTEILNQDSLPLRAVEGDFWRASGYSGGENWTEAKLSESITLKIKEPGSYAIRVLGQAERPSEGSVRVELAQSHITRYYVIGMLFFLILGGIQRVRAGNVISRYEDVVE